MARATRSAKQQDSKTSDQPVEAAPPVASKGKAGSKKRKRTSIAGPDEPAAKQLRVDDAAIKEEDNMQSEATEDKPAEMKGAGDVPLDPEDAQRILDILEMVDTQGLLDRVFPLPADPAHAGPSSEVASSSQLQSYSFRTLLKESSRHPLRVLRSAVQPLFPVFAHPRSRPSAPAAQQLKFCNLALSLLDQSSFKSSHSALQLVSIIPDRPDAIRADSEHGDAKLLSSTPSLSSDDFPRKRKYALMQRLPTGEWWTSLNSDFASPTVDGKELKDLPTAHAELVAILPDAPLDSTASSSLIPTLGSYTRKPLAKKPAMPGARRVSVGAFLDYGPYASFAPTFDQDGVEVGQIMLGEVLLAQEKRRRLDKMLVEGRRRQKLPAPIVEDADMPDASDDVIDVSAETLEALLPADQVASIKAMLGSLEVEEGIQELLDRNSRALRRLETLQLERLGGEGGGSSTVEVGSEEWDVAQGISDSIALLASLRPRSSTDVSPLIPSPAVLRKLHRTLPMGPSEGWYGSLPASNLTALRDDTTLHIKSGATIVAPAAVPVAPAPATPATSAGHAVPAAPYATSKPAPATTPYANYGYPTYSGQQYRGTYPYTPNTTAYYPNAYAQTPTAGQASTSHYGNPQYGASGQQQYAYGSSWYNYQQPATPAQPQTGRSTPQPAVAGTPTAGVAAYSTLYTPTAPAPQRAVANTVAAASNKNGWTPQAQGTAGHTPTLPTHLRPAGTPVAPAPGTPTPQGAGAYSYYPGYSQPPQPAAVAPR